MIKVLLADDHKILRIAICQLLNSSTDIRVVAEAEGGENTIRKVRQSKPDVIVLGISIPGSDGLDLIRRLHLLHPDVPSLVLIGTDDGHHYVVYALQAGARGYLEKSDCDIKELMTAIRILYNKKRYLSKKASEALMNRTAERTDQKSVVELLTTRELQVFKSLAIGCTCREIAEDLHVSIKTINTHRTTILRKLNAKNNSQLTLFAIHHGLIKT